MLGLPLLAAVGVTQTVATLHPAPAPAAQAAAAAALPATGSAANGALLFSGGVGFQNRGPSCNACHSAAGLAFPNGGTLGPDLTHVYSRMGAEGLGVGLNTLFFPAMVPVYRTHPLTPAEQADLLAFFQSSDQQAPPQTTWTLAGLAGLGFLILLGITWALGRGRVDGVRRRLVAAARKGAPR